MADGEAPMRRGRAVAGMVMVLGALLVVITAVVVGGEIGRAFLDVR